MAFPSMPRGCISRRGGRRFMPSQKNMRKIERRLSLPNRSNGTRKSAGKLTISRGADGAEAGVGKMMRRPAHKGENKAARDDSFSHRSCASHLTCGNARRQSRWLRFTSLNRCQRGKSAVLSSISDVSGPQNKPVFVSGTKMKLRARGFEIVCEFVPGLVPKAYARTRGGIRRQGGQNRQPN